MLGPLLIFDKSFLRMLNPAEVFELSLRFSPVGTPTSNVQAGALRIEAGCI